MSAEAPRKILRASLAAAALCLLAPRPARAWDSKCSVYEDPTEEVGFLRYLRDCADGPDATHHRLRQPASGALDEHRRIFALGADYAGVPTAALETWRMRVFTLDETAPGTALPTLRPSAFTDAARVQNRAFTVDEFAMLPDFSYSLFDWASGNETCPVGGHASDDVVACHALFGHMGASNANHFPPQSGQWYRRLHAMAVERAGQCATLRRSVAGADAPSERRFAAHWRECEAEALVLEAVGQHYMQDNWSAGHSWERWGASDVSHFSPVFDPIITPFLTPATAQVYHGMIVGAVAGMIHGMEPGLGAAYPDAMCFPHDDIVLGRAGGARIRAGGDDHLGDVLGGISALGAQRDQLVACSAAGIREVYAALGASPSFGALGASRPVAGVSAAIPSSPFAPECEPYRATNQAFSHGLGIDRRLPVVGVTFIPVEALLTAFNLATNLLLPRPVAALLDVEVAQLTYDLTKLALMTRLAAAMDPELTYASSLQGTGEGPYTLLGVLPNRQYTVAAAGPGALASYQDPALPWPATSDAETPDATDRATTLARTFHRAHAADLCSSTTMADLEALRLHAPTDETRCEACVEVVSRHLRVGASAGDHDDRAEPFCALAAPSAPLVYQRVEAGATSPRMLARHWCRCRRGAIAVTDMGLRQLDLNGTATVAETGTRSVGLASLPRDAAVTSDLRAVVTHGDGTLVYLDLQREVELDTDRDASTTTAGAPPGVTRLNAGGSARGVAVVERAGKTFALVTVPATDEVAVFDLGTRTTPRATLCERFDVGRDTARNEDPWDLVVLPDEVKAYVSFRGLGSNLGNAIAILDVPNATDCRPGTGEVVRHFGAPIGTVGPFGAPVGTTAMAVSPNGRRMLIGAKRQSFCSITVRDATNAGTITGSVGCDSVFVYDTVMDSVVSVPGITSGQFRTTPASTPLAVGWFSDGRRALYGSFAGPDSWPLSSPLHMPASVRLGDSTTGSMTYHAALDGQLVGEAVVLDRLEHFIYVGTTAGAIYAIPGLMGLPPVTGLDDFWTMYDADPENALHGLPSWYGGCRTLDRRCVGGYCPSRCEMRTAINLGSPVRALIAY